MAAVFIEGENGTDNIMSNKLNLGVMISGRGSNLLAIINACKNAVDFPAEVSCVVSNNPFAKVSELIKQYGIPLLTVSSKDRKLRDAADFFKTHKVNLVCLAGFNIIIEREFIEQYSGCIVNIHPSLLPSFRGMSAQKQALVAGVRISGCTVHYVVPELDAGPIICQHAVPVLPEDSEQSLSARILEAEHILYPHAIKLLATEQLSVGKQGIKISRPGCTLSMGLSSQSFNE